MTIYIIAACELQQLQLQQMKLQHIGCNCNLTLRLARRITCCNNELQLGDDVLQLCCNCTPFCCNSKGGRFVVNGPVTVHVDPPLKTSP